MNESSNKLIFNRIYKYNKWGYGSGSGSIYIFNKPFINFVNSFLSKHKDIKTIVDVGCGDWQLAKHFNLRNRKYIGCDVSSRVIKSIERRYSSNNKRFLVLDAVTDSFPDGDLVIAKDVLQHLSNQDVIKVFSKLNKYKYSIVVNDVLNTSFINKDIENGLWRPIDITKPPFNYSSFRLIRKYSAGLDFLLNFLRKLLQLALVEKGIYLKQ